MLGPINIDEQSYMVISQKPEDKIYGTAHNSVLQLPGKDQWYIIYHRINKNFVDKKLGKGVPGTHREVCIDRLTFDKQDGHLVEQMLDRSRVQEMQTILEDGLIRYYDEMDVKVERSELKEQLFIEDNTIPLPAWEPFPSKDGLVFTYQQYEIASYAEGMPSFVVPFAEIAPFMTPDARRICGI